MDRRDFLIGSGGLAAFGSSGPSLARSATASSASALLGRWLSAFNAVDPDTYRQFIKSTMPDALAYVDDDLAVRDASGGFELLRTAPTGPLQITAWVKDRQWDRFSRVVLTAKTSTSIDDITFAGAQPPEGFSIARLDERQALLQFDRKLSDQASGGHFAGAVLVAGRGKILFHRAYGLADIARGRKADIHTRYCIGSMGKMFTAVSIVQMVQAGQVRLQDLLARYLPDYPDADLAKKVTIEHLLTHTGGTGDIFGPAYDGHATLRPSDFIRLYGRRPPLFEPGARSSYSNYGYVLLGAVIEQVSGRPYENWYDARLFRPAGMIATSATGSGADTAIPYTGAPADGLKPLTPYVGVPAGGGYSTVQDLNAFASALGDGRLLDREHLRLLLAGRAEASAMRQPLGFVVKKRNRAECYGHGGSAEGVNGDLAVFPASSFTTVVLCNRGNPVAVNAAEFIGARLPAR